jgi:hypothetical protein
MQPPAIAAPSEPDENICSSGVRRRLASNGRQEIRP